MARKKRRERSEHFIMIKYDNISAGTVCYHIISTVCNSTVPCTVRNNNLKLKTTTTQKHFLMLDRVGDPEHDESTPAETSQFVLPSCIILRL
jgi:hypothetical protein